MHSKVLSFIILATSLIACGAIPSQSSLSTMSTMQKQKLIDQMWNIEPEMTQKLLKQMSTIPSDNQESFLINALNSLPENHSSVQGHYPGGLTKKEVQLCLSHLVKCHQTKETVDHARSVAPSTFRDGAWLGRQDAFRHAYWNALMVAEIDSSWASKWATAHESETPTGNDKSMDLKNNSTGRNLSSSGAARSVLASRVKSKILSGGLVCLKGETPSGAIISTHHIPCKNR